MGVRFLIRVVGFVDVFAAVFGSAGWVCFCWRVRRGGVVLGCDGGGGAVLGCDDGGGVDLYGLFGGDWWGDSGNILNFAG